MLNQLVTQHLGDWQEEICAEMLTGTSTCIGIYAESRELIFANLAMSELLGTEPANCAMIPSLDSLFAAKCSGGIVYQGFLTIGGVYLENNSIEASVYRKDNKLFIIGGINALQLAEQNKTLHGLNTTIGNLQRNLIKEKHSLEQALQHLHEANTQLAELDKTKNKLFSVIAHDLKGPFTTILGFSHLLLSSPGNYDKDKTAHFLQIIHAETNKMLKLLQNLLHWAKSQTGKISFVPEYLSLANVITETVDFSSATASYKEIHLLSADTDLAVYSDGTILQTILRNLIFNAIKFTKPGGEIRLSAQQNGDFIEMSVSDNGVGMDTATLHKLFGNDISYSTDGTADEKGSGLGLIICKEFAELQGGTIWVESTVGEGSRFVFTIPLAAQYSQTDN